MFISIITINYNNAIGLEKTLSSLQSQTWKQFESVVIDGGSNDASIEVIEKYSNLINYWTSKKDNGIYDAMNKGILEAKGEYLLFLNSGDYLYDSTCLESFFSNAFNEDVAYGDMKIETTSGDLLDRISPKLVTKEHLHLDTIWHPVTFYKKQLFIEQGLYDLNFKIVADYEFLLRLYYSRKRKISWRYVPVFLSVFVMDGLSSNPNNQIKLNHERKKAQLKNYPLIEITKVYLNILKHRIID